MYDWTLKAIWKDVFVGIWKESMGISPFPGQNTLSRCDFCGRRIGWDAITRQLGRGNFITTCFYHGKFDGQVVIDCMTGCQTSLLKEPMFYHETVLLDEIWFYVCSVCRFAKMFINQLPINILGTIKLLAQKGIEKERKRLGYK